MQPELALKALGYGVIGLLLITMLVLTFASMRKEERWGAPLSGLFWLTLVVLGLCTFVALCSACQAAKSQKKISPRLQTEMIESHS
jgi:drug/metabolite transporter (DMT)-like permease